MLAGPEEATLVGNLLVQAMALGEIGSLREARDVVRASFEPVVYEPEPDCRLAGGTRALRGARRRRRAGEDRMSVTGVLRGIPAPENRWESSAVERLGVLDALVYRSNLLGADRALANIGGGNTSAKETVTDHVGREVRVLWVKGSGTDLATITAAGFPGLRLDELLPLESRDEMDDAAMVALPPALQRAP